MGMFNDRLMLSMQRRRARVKFNALEMLKRVWKKMTCAIGGVSHQSAVFDLSLGLHGGEKGSETVRSNYEKDPLWSQLANEHKDRCVTGRKLKLEEDHVVTSFYVVVTNRLFTASSRSLDSALL